MQRLYADALHSHAKPKALLLLRLSNSVMSLNVELNQYSATFPCRAQSLFSPSKYLHLEEKKGGYEYSHPTPLYIHTPSKDPILYYIYIYMYTLGYLYYIIYIYICILLAKHMTASLGHLLWFCCLDYPTCTMSCLVSGLVLYVCRSVVPYGSVPLIVAP